MLRETLTLIKTILFDTPWKELALFTVLVFLMTILTTVVLALVMAP